MKTKPPHRSEQQRVREAFRRFQERRKLPRTKRFNEFVPPAGDFTMNTFKNV